MANKMVEVEVTIVTSYIMYYDLLSIDGSFFSKVDRSIELAKEFIQKYSEQYKTNWTSLDWEETLNNFMKDRN